MDFFEHRYYTLIKTLMTLVGQWPYQNSRARHVFLVIVTFINATNIMPVMTAFIKYRDNLNIQLDCCVAMLFLAFCFTKLICFMCNSQTTLQLVNRIRMDWQVWAWDREVDILHEYTEQGQKSIILYTVMMYSFLFVFMTEPVVPKIIDVLLMNGTEPGRFPIPLEYNYFNAQKYYFHIIIYSSVCVYVLCTVLIANDVMLIVYVQHGCGIFAALGHKLERIRNNVKSAETEEIQFALEKRDMVHLTSCIKRHNDAIEYANLIEVTYAWTFLVLIGLGMILINVIGLQVLVKKSDPKSTIRFILFAFSSTVFFAMISYLSQILMDHSDNIRFYVYNSEWYRLSPKAQKLLQLMTMRCSVSCQLTMGKFFTMGMRTFGLTARTNLSYFAVVRSMQQL